MQNATVLLLDSDSTAALNPILADTLSSISAETIHLRLAPPAASESEGFHRQLQATVLRLKPDIALLLCSVDTMKCAAELVPCLKSLPTPIPIVVVIQTAPPEDLLRLLRLGVDDFVTMPLNTNDLLPRLWRLLDQRRKDDPVVPAMKRTLGLRQLVGQSPSFRAQIEKIPLLSKCDASVLILGETGTGKELCARAIHYLSPRSSKALIPVNCGAIPVDLIENELFGHERGAFTGASGPHAGVIQEADGGTLFLDEIDCLPLASQVKLLRFVQEKEYRPLGSTKVRYSDVRLIAATNADVDQSLREGRLRRDLYYRLNVISLHLPPLRERRDDIPSLAGHFLRKYEAEYCRPPLELSGRAVHKLLLYSWPGNVRELEHVIQRAVALAEHVVIDEADIAFPCSQESLPQASFQQAKANVIVQFERSYIHALMVACRGNITKAAVVAGKDRRAFWELLRKHHVDASSFRSGAEHPE